MNQMTAETGLYRTYEYRLYPTAEQLWRGSYTETFLCSVTRRRPAPAGQTLPAQARGAHACCGQP